jgi:hypothetical protein
MKIKSILIFWVVVAVVSAITTWLVLTRKPSTTIALPRTESAHPPQPSQVSEAEPPQAPRKIPSEPRSDAPRRNPTTAPAQVTAPESVEDFVPDTLYDDPVFKEQLGRYALSYVGADPVADEVWAWLIYDPDLSEKVREDLMEDLNENGFSDGNGRRATMDDLPLIESRLALLEGHLADADEFMFAHLGEAYKDLMNMWLRLSRQ